MTETGRSRQDILADQFRTIATLSEMTGQYHRLLQRVSGASIERMHEEALGGDGAETPALAAARAAEAEAQAEAETFAGRIDALDARLSALGRELAGAATHTGET